jgi:hypothetical protein
MVPIFLKHGNISILLTITKVLSGPANSGLNRRLSLMKTRKVIFQQKELTEIEKLINEYKEVLLSQLDLFYNRQPIKAIRK